MLISFRYSEFSTLGIEFREDLNSEVLNSRCFYIREREIKYQ